MDIFSICPAGSGLFKDSCFWLTPEKVYRAASYAACAKYDGRIAVLYSVDEQWILYYTAMTSRYAAINDSIFHIGKVIEMGYYH